MLKQFLGDGFLTNRFMCCFTGLLLALLAALQPPPTMTKIVVRLSGPGIKPGSYAALPKTIYRAGEHYARLENPPDTRQRTQKVTIIAEPDAYSVDLMDKRGTHAIDPGGPNDLHLPVILPFDPNHRMGKLDRLEFGDELEFFEDAGAKPEAGPIVNAQPTDAYRLDGATLVTHHGTHQPIFLSWKTKDGTYKYEYIRFEDKPFEPKLFSRPPGIQYKEIAPPTVSEQG
jgi:hypothetical protein